MSKNPEVIKAGYKVTISTWEGDADYPATKSIDGLSKSAARFVVNLAMLFKRSFDDAIEGYGNMYNPSPEEIQKWKNAISRLIDLHYGEFPNQYCQTVNGVHEFAFDLGLMGAEDQFTRMCEDVSVVYVPTEVTHENVTSSIMSVPIFEKKYDGESIIDLGRDVEECISDDNTAFSNVPVDQYGIQQGYFTVKVEWTPE